MGVQPGPSPSPPILVPYITGLDPFKAMAMSVAAAQSTSVAARNEGALSRRHCHCHCFGFIEMLDQEAKA